jgi:hypothetical protein
MCLESDNEINYTNHCNNCQKDDVPKNRSYMHTNGTKWAYIYVNIKMAVQKTTTPYFLS